MYKNKFIINSLFFVGLVLTAKFVFDVAYHPTDPFMLFTLLLVVLSFGNVRHIVLLPELSQADLEAIDSILKRLFKAVVICLLVCLLANMIYPATGVLTTVLTWVIGHTAFAIWKGSAACSMLLRRLDKQIKASLIQKT